MKKRAPIWTKTLAEVTFLFLSRTILPTANAPPIITTKLRLLREDWVMGQGTKAQYGTGGGEEFGGEITFTESLSFMASCIAYMVQKP